MTDILPSDYNSGTKQLKDLQGLFLLYSLYLKHLELNDTYANLELNDTYAHLKLNDKYAKIFQNILLILVVIEDINIKNKADIINKAFIILNKADDSADDSEFQISNFQSISNLFKLKIIINNIFYDPSPECK